MLLFLTTLLSFPDSVRCSPSQIDRCKHHRRLRLQFLSRSFPEERKALIETLKMRSGLVAGTEVAQKASDRILADDNFSSVVKAIAWRRCVLMTWTVT